MSNNSSYGGGGLYAWSNLSIINTTFISNTAQNNGGGAEAGGATAVSNSHFENNRSNNNNDYAGGGGLYIGSSLAITNTSFLSNTAQSNGGGIFASSSTLNTVEFNRNRAGNGGGLYIMNGPLIQSGGVVTMTYNNAITRGGGLYMRSNLTLNNARILSNAATTGGAIYHAYGTASVTNSCIVSNNDTAVDYAGGGLFGATGNWWGAASGPSGAGPGSGDSVSSNVNYSGFLSSAIPGCPSKGSGLTYTISGRATSGSTPLAGVVVRASNGFSATTNASGYYTLTNLIAGTYILTPTLSGYSFSPVTRTVNLSGNQTGQDFIGAQGGSPQQTVYLPIVLK